MRSGIYAIRLRAGKGAARRGVHRLLRPPGEAESSDRLPGADGELSRLRQRAALLRRAAGAADHRPAADRLAKSTSSSIRRRDFGMSTYDTTSTTPASATRATCGPILNMRPKYRLASMGIPWQFPADLSIIGWLEHMRLRFRDLTDEDSTQGGLAAIKPYNLVISGTHPEYYSEEMLDATEDYLDEGGRLHLHGRQRLLLERRLPAAKSRLSWRCGSSIPACAPGNARPGEHYLRPPA